MQNQIFEAALGIVNPWYVNGVDFNTEQKSLSIHFDFVAGILNAKNQGDLLSSKSMRSKHASVKAGGCAGTCNN
ncbi:MAG: hypothetical protein ACLQHK_14235 [Gallionellaceae bacterium]